MWILRLVLGMLCSFLPECYRTRGRGDYVSARDVIVSGSLQLVACLGILLYRYILFADRRILGLPDQVTLGAMEKGGETGLMGMGIFVLLEYLIQPVTIILLYFVVEGLVRISAGVVSGEIVPTLPLELMSLAHGAVMRRKAERALGPIVEDIVQKGSGDFALTVATCRPKPWNTLTTISYNDEMFELASEQTGAPPRKWIYVLRKRPEGKIVRGLYRYEPDELVKELAAK